VSGKVLKDYSASWMNASMKARKFDILNIIRFAQWLYCGKKLLVDIRFHDAITSKPRLQISCKAVVFLPDAEKWRGLQIAV